MHGELGQNDQSDEIVLRVTRAELLLLAGSVNEAMEALEDWEFPIRIGAGVEDARVLRSELSALIARLPPE
jgi:hypothetical protein